MDMRDEAILLSKQFNADVVVDTRNSKEEVLNAVQAESIGGVDATVCISDHPDATALACAVTKMHGLVIQIALPEKVMVPYEEFIFRDIKIHGSLVCSPEESKVVVGDVAKYGIQVKTNVFHGLNNVQMLIDFVKKGKMTGKAVVVIDSEQLEQEKNFGQIV
jgi:D-arabinose 1-dehydrogenase-like Zn-dependent alcohol dehydrogenase